MTATSRSNLLRWLGAILSLGVFCGSALGAWHYAAQQKVRENLTWREVTEEVLVAFPIPPCRTCYPERNICLGIECETEGMK